MLGEQMFFQFLEGIEVVLRHYYKSESVLTLREQIKSNEAPPMSDR